MKQGEIVKRRLKRYLFKLKYHHLFEELNTINKKYPKYSNPKANFEITREIAALARREIGYSEKTNDCDIVSSVNKAQKPYELRLISTPSIDFKYKPYFKFTDKFITSFLNKYGYKRGDKEAEKIAHFFGHLRWESSDVEIEDE
jgi:hypothetical protein